MAFYQKLHIACGNMLVSSDSSANDKCQGKDSLPSNTKCRPTFQQLKNTSTAYYW